MAVKHNIWEPITLNKGGPKLSHLCFADDIVLFGKVSMEQVELTRGILELFCWCSSQKVSYDKSCIYFSENVNFSRKRALSEALGMRLTLNLGKYLGVPLLHGRTKTEDFQFIIDRMMSRLSTWKARNLSLAGRVTLTQSALTSIPTYIMQTMRIPLRVCDKIDSICRSFIWGGNNSGKKIHLLS
ncbi:uncharacterized protein [Arachis hypogaea]|uniref:uncharacterized protein n=1 Tax=Arachis hypogaea TaxID=3818 RepID=UPI003B2242BD